MNVSMQSNHSLPRTALGHTASPWRKAALVWTIALLVFVVSTVALCPGGSCTAPPWDRALLQLLHQAQHPWTTAFFSTVTWLGSIMVLLPLALLLAWQRVRQGQLRAALLLPLAVGGAWLWAHAAKLLVARPRPDLYSAVVAMPTDLSFPSAHTMQITAFVLALLLARATKPQWFATAAGALVVCLVAVSRPYLQVHFPSDVLIGLILGAAWVVGLRMLLERRA